MKATISVDANEYRVVWMVYVEDENGDIVERRPFATPEDAKEFAEQFGDDYGME